MAMAPIAEFGRVPWEIISESTYGDRRLEKKGEA